MTTLQEERHAAGRTVGNGGVTGPGGSQILLLAPSGDLVERSRPLS